MITRLWLTRALGAGAEEHERSGPVELVERGLDRGGATRALERERERLGDRPSHRRRGSASGVTTVAPSAAARSRRAGAGSLTVMSSTPAALSTAIISRPTGPAPVTSTRSPGRTPDTECACIAIATGSVSAAERSDRPVGQRKQPAGVDVHVAGERAGAAEEVGRRPVEAHRGATGAARPARSATGPIGDDDRGAQRHRRSAAAPSATTVPDHSWPNTEPLRPMPSRTKCRSVPQIPQCETSTSALLVQLGNRDLLHLDTPEPTYTAAGIVAGSSLMLPPGACGAGPLGPRRLARPGAELCGGAQVAARCEPPLRTGRGARSARRSRLRAR